MNCRADAHVGGAAADVAIHRGINVRVGWLLVFAEQTDRRHDLPRLAVAALDHVEPLPCRLHGAGDLAFEPLDGGDLLAGRVADWRDARTYRLAVDVNRT